MIECPDIPAIAHQACVGKAAFDNWDVASAVAKRRSRGGKPSQPYRCDHCRRWHLAGSERFTKRIKTRRGK